MMNAKQDEVKQPQVNRWQVRLEAEKYLEQLKREGFVAPIYREGVLVVTK